MLQAGGARREWPVAKMEQAAAVCSTTHGGSSLGQRRRELCRPAPRGGAWRSGGALRGGSCGGLHLSGAVARGGSAMARREWRPESARVQSAQHQGRREWQRATQRCGKRGMGGAKKISRGIFQKIRFGFSLSLGIQSTL